MSKATLAVFVEVEFLKALIIIFRSVGLNSQALGITK